MADGLSCVLQWILWSWPVFSEASTAAAHPQNPPGTPSAMLNSIQVQHHKVLGKKPRPNSIARVSNLRQKLNVTASPTRNYRLERGKRGK